MNEFNSLPPSFSTRLKPSYAVIPMTGGVQLRAGDEEIIFLEVEETASAVQLLRKWQRCGVEPSDDGPLARELQNALTVEGLWTSIDAAADPPDVYFDHARLARPGELDRAQVALLVSSDDDSLASRFAEVLHAQRVSIVDSDAGANARLVVWNRPDQHRIRHWNSATVAAACPCLFVDLSHGRHATIGPFYEPDGGACYACFRRRLRENTAALAELAAAEELMMETKQPLPSFGSLPAHDAWVAGVAVAELVAYFVRHRPLRTRSRAVTIDLEALRMWSEPVWRIPWCEICGTSKPQ